MELVWKAFLLLWVILYLHTANGLEPEPHDLDKRDIDASYISDKVKMILSTVLRPVADIVEKADFHVPYLSGYSTKEQKGLI
ncbi:uncharacterized protein Dana_GF24177 [Drosophila ananassae]|uniref:Uncharacterized protein n=1 Tax=Drosophila ananassae TaxID=7217 RepID=B3M8M6_DROAN|nr:uncharacterized protein Dana_GF24177 [Drosophila ananassae]